MLVEPPWTGVPLISPVAVFILSPAGRPTAEKLLAAGKVFSV